MSNLDLFLSREENHKILFFGFSIILTVLSVYFLIQEQTIFIKILLFLLAGIIIFFYFKKVYLIVFIASLIYNRFFYFPLRLQICFFLALIMIFFFITYKDSGIFNFLSLPVKLKRIAVILILAVFASSFFTPFFSFNSVYLGFYFLTLIFISYITFRSVNKYEDIRFYLNVFVVMVAVAGLSSAFEIITTGRLRATGIAGFPYMEFAPFTLLIIIFRDFLFGKHDIKINLIAILLFTTMIANQSRFAWLGFLLALIYGLIMSSVYSKETYRIIRKRFPLFILGAIFVISIMFIFRLDQVIFSRVSDINLSLFSSTEGDIVSNSLETRFIIWIVAVNAFLQNPVTGIGYFMFNDVSVYYNVFPDIFYNRFVLGNDPHTTYMAFLAETGIFGLLSFLIYIITIFSLSVKAIKLTESSNEIKYSIIFNVLVFYFMVHSIYAGSFTYGTNGFQMHFILGLAVANYVFLKKKMTDRLKAKY